jgi:hypothetical protein
VDAKGLWSNREDYLNGKTDTIEFTWKPGQKTSGTLMVSRRWESKPAAAPEQMSGNLQQLTNAYMDEIPIGAAINILEMPTGGWFNNLFFAHIFGEGRTCGSYQNYVMDFLDGVRTNSDPNVRRMLAGYEYGPIQTNGGGHVAVVVFPSGTDWTKTGTVFDPWPTQRPAVYNINTWFASLGLYAYSGYYPEPSYGMDNAYPQLTGKPASYPAQGDVKRPPAQPVRQILVINSPVTVMLKMKDGRQVGVMPNKTGMNQAPRDVSFYTLPKDGGGRSWFFFLPDGAVDVTVYGQQEGTVHIALVTEDTITGYRAQPIHEAEAATFSINSQAHLGTVKFESGATAEAVKIASDDFKNVMGAAGSGAAPEMVPPLVGTRVPSQADEVDYGGDGGSLTIFVLGCCCCLVVIGVMVVVIVLIRARRKKRPLQ